MRLETLVLALTLLFLPIAAIAHDALQGPNGGQTVDDAGHHVEFTMKDGQIVFFLSDGAGKPISSTKASGRAMIQDGAKQAALDLVAAKPNLLVAKTASPLSPGAKLVVSIKLGDGHDVKARFVVR